MTTHFPTTRFKTDCEPTPEHLLVRFSGRLILDPRCAGSDWRACLDQVAAREVVLDLSGVTDIDASGLGLIAQITEATRQSGRRFSVVSASPRVRRLLSLTRLDAAIGGIGRATRGSGPKLAA